MIIILIIVRIAIIKITILLIINSMSGVKKAWPQSGNVNLTVINSYGMHLIMIL